MKTKALSLHVATVTLLLTTFPAVASANLIVNAGFETGNFSGWTQSGNSLSTAVTGFAAHSGFFGAQFGSVGTLGFVSQTIATTPGATYALDYWLANVDFNHNGLLLPNEFRVEWNGAAIASTVNASAFPYIHVTISGLVAAASSTTLTFGFRQDPSYWLLDDINLVAAAGAGVPDTASAAGLMAMALGGLAWVRRRLTISG